MSATRVRRLVLGELQTNCWLVEDGLGGPLVVIDPAGEADAVLRAIDGRDVAAVVLTHGHFDHLGAVSEVVSATRAPLAVHVLDAPALTDAAANGSLVFGYDITAPAADRLLEDGDTVEAGTLRLAVVHTPGHTIGSISLFAPSPEGGDLFSGDTLFAGSVGRTDLPGGDARALRDSLRRLAALSPDTAVHPGHGLDTTLRREARSNIFWPRT